MTVDTLVSLLAERVMGWGAAPNRFLVGNRCWMPRWRFQPTKNLENATALLEAADPAECSIARHGRGDWSATVRIGGNTAKARAASPEMAITLAVAQAFGLDVTGCE
jgi:hypothetical protein